MLKIVGPWEFHEKSQGWGDNMWIRRKVGENQIAAASVFHDDQTGVVIMFVHSSIKSDGYVIHECHTIEQGKLDADLILEKIGVKFLEEHCLILL